MTAIRTLIVDDEPLARRGVRQLLAPYPDFVVVGECRDGREALRALARLEPDLVFLDVQMPGLDGLEVIRAYGPARMPPLVFVTAYDQFAVQAFEAAALDYLVKPLGEARFGATVARVRERLRTAGVIELAERLNALLAGAAAGGPASGAAPAGGGGRPTGGIAFRHEGGELLLEPDEIDRLEADDDHVLVHAGGRVHRVRETLADFETRLGPERFVRIHRGAIVRIDRIRALHAAGDRAGASVTLRDGVELPVSRRRLARVRAVLRSAAGRP